MSLAFVGQTLRLRAAFSRALRILLNCRGAKGLPHKTLFEYEKTKRHWILDLPPRKQLMSLSRFSFPTTILFGPGAIDRLPEELRARGMQRPLLVTDRGLVTTPAAARVRELIPDAPVFSGVDPNPKEKKRPRRRVVLSGTQLR
jgi:hypothetical protein